MEASVAAGITEGVHVTPTLTTSQVEQFKADGYLVVPDFVSEADRERLRSRAAEFEAGERARSDDRTVFSTTDQSHASDEWFLGSGDTMRGFFEQDGTHLNKIGHAMHDLDPVFSAFCRETGFAQVADAIGIGSPELVQSMYIFKHPGVGGEVTWHTDHTFLWTEPRSVVGFWIAIDDATVDNGCMWAIPGGHLLPVKSRFVRDGDVTDTEVYDNAPYPIADAVPLETAAGALVLLDGALPHWSDTNKSSAPRQAFTLHVTDGSAEWSQRNWLQRNSALPFAGF